MRFRLRTLLILLAVVPPVLAWFVALSFVVFNGNDGRAFLGLFAIAMLACAAVAGLAISWYTARDQHDPMQVAQASKQQVLNTKRRSFVVIDRILWSIIGLLAALELFVALSEASRGWPVNWFGLIVGSVLAIVTVLALVRRWGPLLPCMFLGVVFLSLAESPTSSSYEENVYKDLGVPVMGATLGALFGFFWERMRSGNESDVPSQSGRDSGGFGW
jgi:hypothetical protein